MIVKGIIKSIDYTGNTCTVRIPVFESAANENEVVVPATLSTLPGIYNGYKEEDVVFIAFENNNYDMPIVIGKLYLGVENEKNDPRGAIVCNNITAAQPISIPISSQLTLDNDPQHSSVIGVDKGIDSYKSIADLAKNLQKQDEKLGSLSVKVIDDGENLGAEIAKKVSVTDEATKQRGLGWNLNTEKWEIYAKDTVGDNNSLAKLPIMTIDRTGMVISGNLVLTGYPQTTEIKYTNSRDKNTPPTGNDVKWQDNTSGLYQDTYYIWKRTREVFYAYNAEADKWELTKYGTAHYECITGAKGDPGKNGAPGKNGYNTVTVMLYKRSKTSISGEQISTDLYYKFSDQKLYTDEGCADEYISPTGWSYTISDAGDSGDGDLYCIAAIAHSNAEYDKITPSKWVGPTLYVENGADGKPGDSVYTISIDNDFDSVPADVNGNVSDDYHWQTETTHKVRVYYGKEAKDFTVMDQSGTASSTGLCIKYKLTNVTLGNTPSVSSKVATAWINDLSADTGNILYTLYVDGIETGITGKFSATKIKSPAPTYTISIDNDFATIPTSTVNAKIYRKASQKFKPIDNGYNRETITIAGAAKKLPGMRLSAVNNTTNLNTALLWKPDEVIKIASGITKSYVEDITKHNVTVYCNDNVETITTDNFIVKLDSNGLDTDMDTTQNYLVCELGGFDSTGARATDFPGMKPVVNNNVVTNYITALSALGDTSESKNAYIQYTYYVEGKSVATAKFEVTRHTGPTTYYLSSNVSTIKVNKDATITPGNVTCTAYCLDTSTNTNTKFTNGTWKYKWDTEPSLNKKSTSLDLSIDTAGVITNKYKQLYVELYLGDQLWDRETIDVIADGENAVDYKILVDNGQIKRDPNNHTEDTSSITFSFYKWNGSTRSNFNGAHFNYYINGVGPTPRQCDKGTNTFTVNADSNPAISSITKNIKVELLDKKDGTVVESETIDVVVNGSNGLYITNTKQWYKLVAKTDNDPTKPTTDVVKSDENDKPTHTTNEGWSDIPLDAINDMNLWTSLESIFSDDTPKKRHIEFSNPVKDAAYALAQGKTTNYYSPTEPTIYNVKEGDCWFDTGYVKITHNPDKKAGYLGKFVSCQPSITGSVRVEASGANRYIPSKTGSTYLVKITPANIDDNKINIEVGTTTAYETGNLKQWDGAKWVDIAGELVTNKLTANYINALDITAKKINVNDTDGNTLFKANGIAGEEDSNQVAIGGWKAKKDRLYSGTGAKTVSLQSELTNDSFVECIVANGNQYIDTDLYIDYNTDIVEITYQPTTYDQNGMIFGQWDVETASQAALYLYKDGKTIGFYIPFDGEQKALNTYINYTNLSKQTIKIQKESSSNQLTIYVNGRATSFETYTKSLPVATITSYIASGRTHNGTANWGFKGKIYTCKIWRNGSLIRNYAPYYKANTQTYGLFDLCNNTFTSSGSGYKFDGEYSSIYLGSEESRTAPFSVSNTGQVRASDVSLEGHIISDGGRIGGFTISGSSLTSGVRGENDFVAIASDSPIECKVANAFAKYKLIIGNTFGVVEDGKINISNGDFTGSATLNGGKLSNIESIECNNLKIGPINITPTTFGEQTTSVEDVTFKITEGSASYIGGSTIYYVTITASKKLAKALQLPYKISYATYEGKYDSSGYNNKVQKIFFNSAITFPANTLKYEVSVIADSYGQYGLWDFVDVVVSTLGKKGYSVGDIVKEWDAAKNSFTCKANVSSETESWGLQFSQNLIPGTTDNVKASIGTSSQTWKELHCDTAYATYFYGASDRRLKENIKDYIPKNSILDLPVVEFDFKDSGKHQIGCIAQDLQKLFPELVEARDDGYLTIEENKLVYLLLLEIKKLNAKIDNLSATKESKGDSN